jgi:hypothetical protein
VKVPFRQFFEVPSTSYKGRVILHPTPKSSAARPSLSDCCSATPNAHCDKLTNYNEAGLPGLLSQVGLLDLRLFGEVPTLKAIAEQSFATIDAFFCPSTL